jgi:hypothetical protein
VQRAEQLGVFETLLREHKAPTESEEKEEEPQDENRKPVQRRRSRPEPSENSRQAEDADERGNEEDEGSVSKTEDGW